jgi:uncharacterized coiled-coil protein SlyX
MSLNNTLEEELRIILCEQKKEINSLNQSILQLKRMIAEETEAKYRLYVKVADLQKDIRTK